MEKFIEGLIQHALEGKPFPAKGPKVNSLSYWDSWVVNGKPKVELVR